MRFRPLLAACLAAGAPHAVASPPSDPVGLTCTGTLYDDPVDDVLPVQNIEHGTLVLSGGPIVVDGATNVTITCQLVVDDLGRRFVGAETSATRDGEIGYASGVATVPMYYFDDMTTYLCTAVAWQDGAGTTATWTPDPACELWTQPEN